MMNCRRRGARQKSYLPRLDRQPRLEKIIARPLIRKGAEDACEVAEGLAESDVHNVRHP
jgi:hypothetical protein